MVAVSAWPGVYSIVNGGSTAERKAELNEMIVTQATLVRGRTQAYDARNLAQARGEGRYAGKLFLEAQEQA
jgi:hypothetical protein